MANVNHALGIGLPPDQWFGEVLQVAADFDPSEVVANYGYKHLLPDYQQIPEKIVWAMSFMNTAQRQVFIRLLGLDGMSRRAVYEIVQENETTRNWVDARRREIKALMERLRFREILQDKLPFPPEETSTP